MAFLKRHPSQRIFRFRDYPREPVKWFESVVADSRLWLWKPGDSIDDADVRLLLGVATWSGHDLEFLDQVDEFVEGNPDCGVRVEVFPVDEIKDQSQFNQYYPGGVEVFDTPVAGKWVESVHLETTTAHAAKDLVWRTLLESVPNDRAS